MAHAKVSRPESDIGWRRLCCQSLAATRFRTAQDVVGWLGAVQAQDYAGAKWSLGLRMNSASDSTIEAAFDAGRILRTHALRPTWHFVLPGDIRWMLALNAPRVRKILAHHDRTLEVTDKLRSRVQSVFSRALEGGVSLTRDELAQHLERSRIKASGQRLARLVMHAELDALIASGPRRGKRFTYMLLDERAPGKNSMHRDEAAAALALRYFRSHGPAQLKDFAWWSGLTVKESAAALDAVKSNLESESVAEKTYWFAPTSKSRPKSTTFLLSIYDEYVIAYKDRSALGGDRFASMLTAMGNALTSVLIVDGHIAGRWKRTENKMGVDVVVRPLRRLSATERSNVADAATKYGRFLAMPVTSRMEVAKNSK